jgi:hypothetical protein
MGGFHCGARRTFISGLAALLYAVLVSFATQPGPDYERYEEWPKACLLANPERITGTTLSPVGFPVTHWMPATGIYFGLPDLLMGRETGVARGLMQAIAALTLLALFSVTLPGSTGEKIFTVGLLLSGTNLGYYTLHSSSEILVVLAVLGPILLLGTPESGDRVGTLLLGVCAALLLMTRVQAILLLLPALVLLSVRLRCESAGTKFKHLAILGLVTALGLPVALGMNYGMTGKMLASPYAFGDENFRSLCLKAPYLDRIFSSPQFGLVRFHTVSLVGFLLCFRAAKEKLYHRTLAGTFILYTWLISGSYAWSGGISFGARYFLPLAVLLVFPVIGALPRGSLLRSVFLLAIVILTYPVYRTLVPPDLLWLLAGIAFLSRVLHRPLGPFHLTEELAHFLGDWLILMYLQTLKRQLFFNLDPVGARATLLDGAILLLGLAVLVGPTLLSGISRRAPAAFTRLFLALSAGVLLIQIILLLQFLPAASAYMARTRLAPPARYTHIAAFQMENFRIDLAHAARLYEMTPAEISRMRAFWNKAEREARIVRAR